MRTRFAPSSASGVTRPACRRGRRWRRGVRLLLLAAGLLAQPAAAGTQKPPATQGQPAQQGQAAQAAAPAAADVPAGANLVRVDVYPTAGGKPVTDLKQEDFEVSRRTACPRRSRRSSTSSSRRRPSLELAAAHPSRTPWRSRARWRPTPKARLFVLFLDTYHISRGGAMNVARRPHPLPAPALGPDDLVAVTTPELSASAVTFARRTGSIEELVDRFYGGAARRDHRVRPDRRACTCAATRRGSGDTGGMSSTAREMIQRRRERHHARVAAVAGGPPGRRSRGTEGGAGRQRGLDPLPAARQPGAACRRRAASAGRRAR